MFQSKNIQPQNLSKYTTEIGIINTNPAVNNYKICIFHIYTKMYIVKTFLHQLSLPNELKNLYLLQCKVQKCIIRFFEKNGNCKIRYLFCALRCFDLKPCMKI